MKFLAVTTYADRHWEQHARRCVETFKRHWVNVPLLTYTDGGLEAASPWLEGFKARHAHRPTHDYRMDAARFAHKIAAIDLADRAAGDADVLIWIDADCVTHADVTPEWLEGLLGDSDFGYLRRTMKYPECGFMQFRRNDRGRSFIREIVDQYRTDALFRLPEWHDSYVIECVRDRLECAGRLHCTSLSGGAEGTHHPLINGPLGARLDHLKGPRKASGHSNARDLKVHRPEGYWVEITKGGRIESARRAAARAAARRRGRVGSY